MKTPPELTKPEREILRLLGQGLMTKEMAQRMMIKQDAVRAHIQALLEKLKAHSRLEVLTFANRLGLI